MKPPVHGDRSDLVDALLAAALAAVLLVEMLTSDAGRGGSAAVQVPFGLALTLPLALRRRWPLASTGVVMGAMVTLATLGQDAGTEIALLPILLATYSVSAHGTSRTGVAGGIIALAAVLAQEPGDFIVLGPLTRISAQLVRGKGQANS